MLNLSIVKNIIILQIISALSFMFYLSFSYVLTNKTANSIDKITNKNLPISIIYLENLRLLEDISQIFSDAAITGESDILENTIIKKQIIIDNLNKLSKTEDTKDLIFKMNKYFKDATVMINLIINGNNIDIDAIERIQIIYNKLLEQFKQNKQKSSQKILSSLTDISVSSSEFFKVAIIVAIITFSLMAFYSISVIFSIQNRFQSIIYSVQNLATKEPDFSQRISINSNDELGHLANWFNKLQEKLEIDYKNLNSLMLESVDAKKEVEAIHKHTRDSIEYASLIQRAVIPQDGAMNSYFKDNFVTWTPKDTVGGDIWLFDNLRHEDECLLMFIDCTGHGVPGAFVTMIVKAVEKEIISIINSSPMMDISPAWIMGYFNKTIKKLLRQETKDSLSNAGWDGGIIYYNRREQIIKFAGAETPLFYMTNEGEFNTIKGNRYSVGYKKCDANYEYKETIIAVENGMKFYCTTDGYLDQNGGEKDFPFGKKRFGNIIKEHYQKPMTELQNILTNEMKEYESKIPNNDRNDDMTVIAFEIGVKSNYIEDSITEIVKYEGVMTQNVIESCMDNIEEKIENINFLGTISTITIEYCQNMMNYSKNEDQGSRQIVPAGIIEVQYINNEYYNIQATNIISIDDKNVIEPKLLEIQSLDRSTIKKRYRELRKSGQNTHKKGGGIGLYEIAKVSNNIEYNFEYINDDKYSFTMRSIVKPKEK